MPRGKGRGLAGVGGGQGGCGGGIGGFGAGAGGGGRMGGPFAAGPVGECVCPKCGKTVPHQRGVPCISRKCPSCGSVLARKV
ncbi:MAG TPA: hypothetical protein PK821_02440 [Victivallales bacterium]|nr:hypothetical protein [Victivallales bacterium]